MLQRVIKNGHFASGIFRQNWAVLSKEMIVKLLLDKSNKIYTHFSFHHASWTDGLITVIWSTAFAVKLVDISRKWCNFFLTSGMYM